MQKLKYIQIAETIRDAIFGALDGNISTLAVVAGVSGATSNNFIVLVAGASAMLAEALSMGFSSFLSTKVKKDITRLYKKRSDEKPLKDAILFWIATMGGGIVPIMPFFFRELANPLLFSVAGSAVFLFLVGGLVSKITKRNFFVSGLEAMATGIIASVITYYVGYGFSLLA